MHELLKEFEFALDHLIEKRMRDNYAAECENRQWVYQDFANWLVKKFEEDQNAKTR